MIEKVKYYTTNTKEILEPIIKEDYFEYNHVIIKPHYFFPSHPTDANVIITVTKGELWITLEDQEQTIYEVGSILQIPIGTMSKLGNGNDSPTEVFVIKRR